MQEIVLISFGILTFLATIARCLTNSVVKPEVIANNTFNRLKNTFFSAYFLALFSDWLKGAYLYKIYSWYGYKESQIAVFYVTSFASSAVFGTLTGPLTDMYGRRKMSLLFTLTYGSSALCMISPRFSVLLLGRLFGGVATSLLCSTFESWYLYQHTNTYKLPHDWVSNTFSVVTFYNGLLAIIAGVISNLLVEDLQFGPLAPFMAVLPVLFVSACIMMTRWQENYGDKSQSFKQSLRDGLYVILGHRKVLVLGLVQTCVESTMYIFVFLWTPVMENGVTDRMPLGWMFSCFMICIMIGSQISTLLSHRGVSDQKILYKCLSVMTLSMAVCTLATRTDFCFDTPLCKKVSFFCFLILETSIGAYFPVSASLRSKYIPEHCRASIMTWFRLPLNIITCSILLSTNSSFISADKSIMFAVCTILCSFGLIMTRRNLSDRSISPGFTSMTV